MKRLLALILSVVFLTGSVYLVIRICRGINKTRELNQNIISNLRENRESLDEIRQTLISMSRDANEVRWAIGMPEKSYSILKSQEEEKDRNDHALAFFRAVDFLHENNIKEKNRIKFDNFKNEKALQDIILQYGLKIEEAGDYDFSIYRGKDLYFKISYNPDEDVYSIASFLGEKKEGHNINNGIILFLELNIEKLNKHYQLAAQMMPVMESYLKSAEVQKWMAQKNLTLRGPFKGINRYTYTLKKGENNLVTMGINKKDFTLSIQGSVYTTFEEFESQLITVLKELDARSEIQKHLEGIQENMSDVLSTDAFFDFLQSKDLKMLGTSREDAEYIYYDLLDESDNRIGSFAFQKGFGEIYIMDKDDVPLCALKSLLKDIKEVKKN